MNETVKQFDPLLASWLTQLTTENSLALVAVYIPEQGPLSLPTLVITLKNGALVFEIVAERYTEQTEGYLGLSVENHALVAAETEDLAEGPYNATTWLSISDAIKQAIQK